MPIDIIEKFPDLKKKLDWGDRELGIFLSSKLLIGHFNRNLRKAFISEESVIALAKYSNRIMESQKVDLSLKNPDRSEYLVAQEIIKRYPELEDKFNWGCRQLGILLRFKLLEGYYNKTLRKSFIREDSVIELVRYTNNLIETQKVQLAEYFN